jgi:hypothetical protein
MSGMISYILSAFCLVVSIVGFDSAKETWVVKGSSQLKVDGKTTISSFTCSIDDLNSLDTLIYDKRNGHHGKVLVSGKMQVNVHYFDCQNTMMTKDLQKTLKADLFPYMTIRFISFDKDPGSLKKNEVIKGQVEIELAGTKKRMDVHYMVNKISTTRKVLTGTREILFTDFNLKPPSKLGGTIRVRDELQVEFEVEMVRVN